MSPQTIRDIGKGEYKNRGSKFYSFAHPINNLEDYKHLLSIYKNNFPEACHVCSAYRLFVGSRIDDQACDDGEPKGSSGQPILNHLKSYNLVNAAIYVVRIFGGSLLGIPGLIDSYSNAALMSIDNSKLVNWYIKKNLSIVFSYEYQGIVESVVREFSGKIEKKNFADNISMTISFNENDIHLFKSRIKDLSGGKIIPVID